MSHATTRAGRRADIPKSDVSFWVNASYQEVADIAPRALSESTERYSLSSGSIAIALPTAYQEPLVLSIWTTNSNSVRTLQRIDIDRYNSEAHYPVGTPTHYAIYRNRIELHPASNSFYSLELRYRSYVTDLVAETDVPSMSTDWRKAILYLAEAEMWAYNDDTAHEVVARQRYANYVAQLKSDLARRQREQSGMRVRPAAPEVRSTSKRSFDVV